GPAAASAPTNSLLRTASVALELARARIERLARRAAGRRDRDAARVHPRRAVPREEAVHLDLRADRQRVAAPAAALQQVRRPELGAPVRDLAARIVLDVEIDPHVGVRPFDLRDDAPERDRLLGIELGGER